MNTFTTAFAKQARWLGSVGSVLLLLVQTYAQPAPEPATALPAAEQKSNPVPASISPGAAEVIRLAQSGVGEDVIKAYVENSASAFDLSADHILYLRDLGISSDLITEMLNRDKVVRNQSPAAATPAAAPPAAEAPAAPEPTVPVEAPLTPQATEVSSPPAQVNYFYSDLSPYGTWVDLAGYGWCWQPTVVVINRGWSPYCHGGHWLYTDCGWYWRSDYSWGWAPFHYGRWYMHPRCGWVWTPGSVWAPAWVVWRNNGDYCGWAPLPPHAVFQAGVGWSFNGVHVSASFDFVLHANHYTFIGVKDFNERDFSHHRLPPTQVTKIYNNTTIINNYTVNKTTIVNNGIPVERISSAARTPIHRATVRDVPAGSSRTVASTPSAERGQAVVYRHELAAPARTAPVKVQKVDERHPVIQHSTAVPVVSQRQPQGGGAGSVPTTGQRRESPGASRTPSRQGVPQPGAPAPNQTTPGKVEPSPRAPSAPRAPQPAPRPPQPAAVERSSTPPAASVPAREQPPRQSQESVRATPPSRSESAAPGTAAENRGRYSEAQPGVHSGNPHVYYPKGHEQFAGSRSTPDSAPHQSSRSSPPGNSGKQQDK